MTSHQLIQAESMTYDYDPDDDPDNDYT